MSALLPKYPGAAMEMVWYFSRNSANVIPESSPGSSETKPSAKWVPSSLTETFISTLFAVHGSKFKSLPVLLAVSTRTFVPGSLERSASQTASLF